jgi:hypothetical protein
MPCIIMRVADKVNRVNRGGRAVGVSCGVSFVWDSMLGKGTLCETDSSAKSFNYTIYRSICSSMRKWATLCERAKKLISRRVHSTTLPPLRCCNFDFQPDHNKSTGKGMGGAIRSIASMFSS